MEFVEVELKFPLLNPTALMKRLDKVARKEKSSSLQKDAYYVPLHRNFIAAEPVSEWFRIRTDANGKSHVNYKDYNKKQNGEKTVFCDEFETEISDAVPFEKILERLDFKKICVVEKFRSTWLFKDVEIALDDVKDLGWFIELESKGDFESIEDAKKRLYAIANEIGAELGEQDFKGYPKLLIEKQKMK